MSGQVQLRNDDMVTLLRSEFPRSPWGCAFLAFNTVTDANVTGNGAVYTCDFNSEVFDLGNDFAADTFTAPKTGVYLLQACVQMEDLAAAMTLGVINLVTSNRTYSGLRGNWGAMRDSGNRLGVSVQAIADMDVGDTAIVQVAVYNGAGDNADVRGHVTALYTFFSGHRVS